ncbi:hypothetical protein SeMB42_g06474 [Synchytrium endobioticum]|uniref:Uncharacterized protein n=1 Tax=Synchytrium endobioticum TaxID=286115 RepID=A0A507CL55_9FUNG|nr:hypothetical protein SeMB42_g06474 [Synchytrium endobioticum]TPX50705.1 hypothetical protein SeLEV6574_g00732 [Synchytrium endobioticum]
MLVYSQERLSNFLDTENVPLPVATEGESPAAVSARLEKHISDGSLVLPGYLKHDERPNYLKPPSKDKNTPMKRKADKGGISRLGRARVERLAKRCENSRKSDLRVREGMDSIAVSSVIEEMKHNVTPLPGCNQSYDRGCESIDRPKSSNTKVSGNGSSSLIPPDGPIEWKVCEGQLYDDGYRVVNSDKGDKCIIGATEHLEVKRANSI